MFTILPPVYALTCTSTIRSSPNPSSSRNTDPYLHQIRLNLALTLATGNQYFVSKFLMHLHSNEYDAFAVDNWSPTDTFGEFVDMANHREQLLEHFYGVEAAPILPYHCVQFLSAVVNQEIESSTKGRKASNDKRLTAAYAKRVRAGALPHDSHPTV